MRGAPGGAGRLLGVHLGGHDCGFSWWYHARLNAFAVPVVTIKLTALTIKLTALTIMLTAITVTLTAAVVVIAVAFILVML
jgi:hypothetical protein